MRLKYTTLLILNNYGIQLIHSKFFYHVHKGLIMYWIFSHTKQMARAITVGAAQILARPTLQWHAPHQPEHIRRSLLHRDLASSAWMGMAHE